MSDKDEYRELVKKEKKTQPEASMEQIEHPKKKDKFNSF